MKRLLAICICILMVLSGCSTQPKEKVEITLIHGWGSTEEDHVAMREIYQDFEKANPQIHINLISLPTMEAVSRKVEDSIMVGDIPDIVFLAGHSRYSIYQYMVEHNYALDLMPYIDADPEFRRCIPNAMLKYWTTENNQIYTLSDVMMIGGGYWYNREIFDAAGIKSIPKTWSEFEIACKKIGQWAVDENHDVQPMQLSSEGYLYFLSHILTQKGMDFSNGKAHIDQAKMRETLDFLEKIHRISSNQKDINGAYNYRDETSLFNEEKLAICVNGVWGASMILPEIDADYALFPSGEDGLCCESAAVGYVLGNTGDPEKQEASVKFLKYILSEEVQRRILLSTQQLPANPNIDIEDYADKMPRFCRAVATAQKARFKLEIPQQLWSEQQLDVFENHIMEVLSGQMQKQTLIDMIR